jgi:hypothetical protein
MGQAKWAGRWRLRLGQRGERARAALERARGWSARARPQTVSVLGRRAAACFFFFDWTADRIYDLHEQALEPRTKMMRNDTVNEIQTQNEDTEKIGEPRLLQIGTKDTRKDDQLLKPVPRCNLGYGKN